MMDYKLFLTTYYPNANDQRVDDVARFFSYVESILDSKPIEEALIDKGFLCKAFYLQETSGISKPHYLKIKDYLTNLFDYYKVKSEVPSREDVIASQTTICYFKDLDNLLDFIDYVGEIRLSNYNKRVDLANIKTVAALGWYGLTTQEITILPRFCVGRNDTEFWLAKPDGTRVAISERVFNIISTLRSLDEYRGLPSGRKIIFKGDDTYLFRATTATCESITEDHIIQIIRRFNGAIPPTCNNALNFRKLRKNALFEIVYNDNSDELLVHKIMKHMECNRRVAQGYKLEYDRWVELYHKDEI